MFCLCTNYPPKYVANNVEIGFLSGYLLIYNLLQNLPVNLNVMNLIGVTSSYLKLKKRVFWRGDVAAMKVKLGPEWPPIIESLDADIFELVQVEKFLRSTYQQGAL